MWNIACYSLLKMIFEPTYKWRIRVGYRRARHSISWRPVNGPSRRRKSSPIPKRGNVPAQLGISLWRETNRWGSQGVAQTGDVLRLFSLCTPILLMVHYISVPKLGIPRFFAAEPVFFLGGRHRNFQGWRHRGNFYLLIYLLTRTYLM